MPVKLIADSCCDVTRELLEQLDMDIVPDIINVPGHEPIIDSLDLDREAFLELVCSCKEPPHTSCPTVSDFFNRMILYDESVTITVSSKLSATYNSAAVARDLVLEQYPDKKILVVDSEALGAGETVIALYVDSLRRQGEDFETIAEKTRRFVQGLRTIGIVEDIRALYKSGRISNIKRVVATALSFYPVLQDSGRGEIVLRHVVRGFENALNSMVDSIAEMTADRGEGSSRLVLAHCHCPDRALSVRDRILKKCPAISDVIIAHVCAIETVMGSKGMIIIGF